MSKITTLHLAYHVAPLPGYLWNLETLSQYVDVFNGKKVVGLSVLPKTDVGKVESEIKAYLGDDVVIKRVKNDPINRESVTFPVVMRYLDLKAVKKGAAVWFGHTKGNSHTNRKLEDVTRLWANACYHFTLDKVYQEFALEALGRGYAVAGPFRRFGHQRNFPPQQYAFHFSGTFYWLNAEQFFSSDWKKLVKVHRYGIEALPGILFPPELSICTFGDRIKDLYKIEIWNKLLDKKLLELLSK